MKKVLSLLAAALFTVGASAQVTEMVKLSTLEEAQAAGWEGAWSNIEYGYFTPENYVTVDNDYVKCTIEKPAIGIYAAKQAGKNIYNGALYFGAKGLDNGGCEAYYSIDDLYETSSSKRSAILTVEPKVNGKVQVFYNGGCNNRSMYVVDVTANDGAGAVVLNNFSNYGGDVETVKKVQSPTFDVALGHKYYIFASKTAMELYRATFTPYGDDAYQVTTPATGSTSMVKLSTLEEAQAAGWEGAWSNIEYGYFTPENYVTVDDDNVKCTIEKPAIGLYAAQQAGKNIYSGALYFGAKGLDNGGCEPYYSIDDIYETSSGKRSAILTVEPKVNGKVQVFYNGGCNNRSMYVIDVTANNGEGAVVLNNFSNYGGDVETVKKVQSPTFDVALGHKYYIFASKTAMELYDATFMPYGNDNYFSTETTGIQNVQTADAVKAQSDVMYNLAGQRVNKAYKGIVIKNGKKYIAK